MKTAARNRLVGHIAALRHGPSTVQVCLELPGGVQLSASVTHDAVEALDLRVGQPATACFKAYAVMLAVPG